MNVLLVTVAFGWLLLFAHNGLWAQFTGDDLMNLNGYLGRSPLSLIWDSLHYWSTSYRPLGGLWYIALYACFGFNPLPFRVACFGLLAINLGVLWRFTLRLSGSREVAFLVLLLAGYHAWFVDLYYSTGTIYELLCYCFYLGAFNVYLSARIRGLALTWRQVGTLAALYVCALDAKEMAVSLPVLLAAYEAIYHRRAIGSSGFGWPWREGRGVLVTGLLSLPYVIGKPTGAGSLVENPAYRMSVSPVRYLHTFHLYLNRLLYQEHLFRDPNTIQLLVAMLALALVVHSRPMLFAWCFVLVSVLPVAFIAHYSGFFLYLPMAGWALYAAVALAKIRRLVADIPIHPGEPGELQAGRLRIASIAALPVLLALFLAPQHERETAKTLRIFESAELPSRQLAGELIALRPRLPRGARVLFVGDPFDADGYSLLFLTRLLYRDMSIAVEKVPIGESLQIGHDHYDAVFRFQDGLLVDATGAGTIRDDSLRRATKTGRLPTHGGW